MTKRVVITVRFYHPDTGMFIGDSGITLSESFDVEANELTGIVGFLSDIQSVITKWTPIKAKNK